MQAEALDDWIVSLLPGHTLRSISRIVHVDRDRVRAVRDAHLAGNRLFHCLGAPRKATPQIKQAVIELTTRHPAFCDFQIAQIIAEQFSIAISRSTINRLRHLANFKFLPPKRCQELTEV
jgi:transposase